MPAPLLVTTALPREMRTLCARLMATPSRPRWGLGSWEAVVSARPVLLVATGCGAGPTSAVLSRLLTEVRPACVVSAGICGALVETMRTEHLVLAEQARDEGDPEGRDAPMRVLGPALAALAECATPCHRGRVLTIARVIRGEEEKRRLAGETGAISVDMESACVAEECERAGVPWLSVRSVMDEWNDPPALPYERFLDERGDILVGLLVLYALARPWLWAALSRDGHRTRRACESLSRAIPRLLSALGAIL